ncbi:hypothetical protein [Thermococcus sp.]
MELWRDKIFWLLFLGGLAFYLSGIFGVFGSTAIIFGDVLWLSAFVYLTVGFLRRKFGV